MQSSRSHLHILHPVFLISAILALSTSLIPIALREQTTIDQKILAVKIFFASCLGGEN